MGNKAAWAANGHWFDTTRDAVSVTDTNLIVPNSLTWVPITTATAARAIDNIVTEWAYGRLIEIYIEAGSSSFIFRDNASGTNIKLNGNTQVCVEFMSIKFRAVYDASGNEIWVQEAIQSVV